FMSDSLTGLYDGASATGLFAAEYGDGHRGPMSNVFAAPTDWVEANPEGVEVFLEVWDRGRREWDDNKEGIIATYPQHFSATAPEQEAFCLDWVDNRFDWFEDTVYLDEEWVEGERRFYDLMIESDYLTEDAALPEFHTS